MRPPSERPVPTALFTTKGSLPKQAFGDSQRPLSPAATPVFPASAMELAVPAKSKPDASPDELYEVGLTAAAMSYHTLAIEALRDCTALAPDHAPAWRNLAALLRLAGEDAQADAADLKPRSSTARNGRKGRMRVRCARCKPAKKSCFCLLREKLKWTLPRGSANICYLIHWTLSR